MTYTQYRVLSDSSEDSGGRSANLFAAAVCELLEVLDEHLGEEVRHVVVPLLVVPGVSRLQDIVGHALASGRNLEAEALVLHEQDVVEVAIQRRVEQRTGPADLDAAAGVGPTSNPPGVDEPALGVVVAYLLRKQVGVDAWVPGHEWGTEAGGERRLRLLDANLGTRDLGGVS